MKLRAKFIAVMYLVFLVFFVLQKIYVERNLHKILLYDEVNTELLQVQSDMECLTLKNKVIQEYADSWYDIDWDKAVYLYEQEQLNEREQTN